MAKKRNSPEDRMNNGSLIEEYYKKFVKNLNYWLPEGILQVDIDLLHHFDLLNYEKKQNPTLTRYFQVVESIDKLTLINEQFIIWIIPENQGGTPKTYVLVALNHDGVPHLEQGFVTSDVYNSSKLVLRILEKLLFEIQENEESLKPYKKAQ